MVITLDGRSLRFEDVRAIVNDYPNGRRVQLRLAPDAAERMKRTRAVIETALAEGRTIYGVNTGFGRLSDQRVDDLEALQTNLILSHSAGLEARTGESGLMMALRANSLAYGNSGVTPELVQFLIEMYNRGVCPEIPELGSCGASGDLVQLAELGAVMTGYGAAYVLEASVQSVGDVRTRARRLRGMEALERAGLAPYRFRPKEALSLINGTQYMCATLGRVLVEMEEILKLADLAGAMSLEALKGSVRPFDERLHALRPHPGQAASARNVRTLLDKSEILESHRECKKVQDAYSLRCLPQVHGAARDAFEEARRMLLHEINSVTDNPIVFENGDIISGGNFHGQPIAQAADAIASALASLANISERRIERLTNPDLSELPAFLVKESGINSGFMMTQVVAASLAAECRVDATPASVQTIPTGAAKEDHVSMGPLAARKARRILRHARTILGIEILCAAQALDFLRPLKPGAGVQAAYEFIRHRIPHLERDRYLRNDIQIATHFYTHRQLLERVDGITGGME
ncbi:MAG: histidine ammonia-lyase [Planctomycetes bacterium]|nr:histidine ammonia-lyase [Planctomycetota bacterium]